jgi:hypothetical protein
LFDPANPHGIQNDIPTQFQQMALLINKDRLESPLKNMSRTFMVSVKKLGIDTVELSHAEGEIGIQCLD